MPRITPSSSSLVIPDIEPDEFYEVTLTEIDRSPSKFNEGESQLQLRWDYGDAGDTLDWLGLRLGKQKNGTVAKLRQMLNSISGKPFDAEIAWFDTETLEFSYEKDGEAFNKLAVGATCLARAIKGEREDGTPILKIDAYRPVKKTAKKAAPVSQDVDPNEIPF
jgi:hypothetical protein